MASKLYLVHIQNRRKKLTKKTHMLMGIAVTIPFVNWSNAILLPIAIIGSFAADLDCIVSLKHRGITHTLLALICSSGALSLMDYRLGLLWGINYATHLILDSFTTSGVPIIYPISKKHYGFRLFKTRGAEDLFTGLLALYFIITIVTRD